MKRVLPFVIAAVLLAGAAITSRQYNHAIASDVATLLAGEHSGSATAVTPATIQVKVHQHMATRATFVRQEAYNTAVAQAQVSAQAQATNSQIYAAAQAACGGKTDSITQAKCNAQYLSQHLVTVPTAAPLVAPKLGDYTYDFRAPVWTPDTTGLLAGGALLLVIIGVVINIRRRHA